MSNISTKFVQLKAELLNTGKMNPHEIFLFNSTTNRGFMVEGIASYFCKKMDGQKRFSEIISDFENEYQVSISKYEKDVAIFTDDLIKNDLIITSDEPIAPKI